MLSRPLLRVLPLVVTAAAFFGGASNAFANAAPVCTPIMQTVAPNPATRQVTLLIPFAFCTDADADSLTYTVSGGTKGTVDTTNIDVGSFTYTPNAGATGDDQLTLVARDPSQAASTPVAITMRITTANQAPICLDDPRIYPVAKNKPKLLAGHCYDPDFNEPTPTYSPLPPDHGASSPANGGLINYVPNHDYLGQDVIHYTMTDAHGAKSAGSGTTIVNVANEEAPNCPQPSTIVQRTGTPITVTAQCTDDVGTPMSLMTFQVFKQPLSTIATITSDDFKGHWTLTPVGPPYVSNVTDSFTYKATNFAGPSDLVTQQFQFVDNFNSKPVCTSLNQQPRAFVHEGKPLTLRFQCTDAQGDPITSWAKTSGSSGGTLASPVQSSNPSVWTAVYNPPSNNYEGPEQVTVTPDDAFTGGSTNTLSIDLQIVSDANEGAPICQPGTMNVHNNATAGVIFVPDCDDAESDALTATLGTGGELPQHGTVTGPDANGVFLYVPSSSYTGPDAFTLHVSDGIKSTALAVAVTVLPPNNPPVCPNLSLLADHTAVSTFNLLAACSDPDTGDTMTAVVDSATVHGSISPVGPNGTVTYKPASGFAGGDDTFTYHVFDSSGDPSGTMTATIHVDQLPVCTTPTPSPVPVLHNKALSFSPCTDPDNDVLGYVSDVDPAHGSLSTVNGKLVFTPTSGYAGADQFSVHADDGRGGQSAPTLVVNVVVAADNAPTCTAASFTFPTGTSKAIPLTCSDPDGDTVTQTIVRLPAHGTLTTVKNGQVTYTPFAGFGGADSFTYRGTDSDPSKLTSAQMTITLNVTGGTAPPTTQTTLIPPPPPATTTTTPTTPTTPTGPKPPPHAKTLAEIAQEILKKPVAQVDVGFGKSVPAFVVKGVGSTLKVSGRSTVFLVYFCDCKISINQVLSGGGTPHTAKARKGTTVTSTLKIPKPAKMTLKLSAGQYKALTKGQKITLKVTLSQTGPKPKNKKQKAKVTKKVRTWKVQALKVKKAKRR